MKKAFILLLTFAIVFSIAACKESPEVTKPSKDLTVFLQTAEMPENLSVAFDASTVRTVSSAKIYNTKILELDPDMVTEKLLRREVIASEIQATGPWYQTGNESFAEYLVVYDGGKRFGQEVDVNGGLSYLVQINGQFADYTPVISSVVGPPDLNEQLFKNLTRSDYASASDLSFMTYEDALAKIEEQMIAIGLPPIALAETYSLDLDTMRNHYSYYLEEYKNQENLQSLSFSRDDEAYQFHFRQLIDNIPVINVSWEWGKGTATGPVGNKMKYSLIDVTFSKDGITNMHAQNILDVEGAIGSEKQPLISASEALQDLIDEYEQLLLDKGTRIVSAELCYVSIPDKGAYELIPAWVFGIAKPFVFKGTHTDNYSFHVVNAITGEKMSGMR